MSHASTALIVVDAQESFRHRDYWTPADFTAFSDRLQALIDGARRRRIPIVQIFHVEETGAFSLASGFVKTLAPIAIEPDIVYYKHRHSALVGTDLPIWLTERGIRRLIVSGIRTEQCCETTTRHASDLGFDVDFVSEATPTFPMTARDGRTYTPAEIRARTELVLADRFARIATVDEALAGAEALRAA